MVDRIDRRQLLKTASVVGLAGLAGCSGNGGNDGDGTDGGGDGSDGGTDGSDGGTDGSDGGTDGSDGGSDGSDGGSGDKTTLVASIHQQGTSAMALGQAMGNVVNENTDSLQLDVRPSNGPRENVGKIARGESDLAFLSNLTLNNVQAGNEPYGNVEVVPQQVLTFFTTPWYFVTTDPEIETVADIGQGDSIAAGPLDVPSQVLADRVLQAYGAADYQFRDITYGDFSSSLSSGQVNVALGNYLNFASVPPWVETMRSSNDLYIVDYPDDGGTIEEDALLTTTTFESFPEGFERAPETPWTSYTLLWVLTAHPDVPADGVTELLETMNSNQGALADAHALYNFHENRSFWLSGFIESVPVQPEAAQFYRDGGVWQDSFTVGE